MGTFAVSVAMQLSVLVEQLEGNANLHSNYKHLFRFTVS
jgi:hypothetical protein